MNGSHQPPLLCAPKGLLPRRLQAGFGGTEGVERGGAAAAFGETADDLLDDVGGAGGAGGEADADGGFRVAEEVGEALFALFAGAEVAGEDAFGC